MGVKKTKRIERQPLWETTRLLPVGVCGVLSLSGRHQEPIGCGLPIGHSSGHAWASLPTFTDGKTEEEAEVAYLRSLNNVYSSRLDMLSDLVLEIATFIGSSSNYSPTSDDGRFDLATRVRAAANLIRPRLDEVEA